LVMTQHSISRAFYSCVKQYRNSLEVYWDSCHISQPYSAVSVKSVLLCEVIDRRKKARRCLTARAFQ